MLDRLILHVGATKTGTSAIQSALARNRAMLLANGILYPPNADNDDKARAGRVTGGNGGIFRSLYNKYEDSPKHALKKFEAELRGLVSRSSAKALLISHERGSGIAPELLHALQPVFLRYFGRVQVIYYVRHVTDHAISQYGEYVKRRRMKNSFNTFAPQYRAPFKRTIETYESVFDDQDIACVSYDDVRDNLYQDFASRIGLPLGPDVGEPEHVNRSLTPDEIDVLRRVNRLGLTRTLIAQIAEDYTFHNKHPKRRHMPVSRAAIEAIAAANKDVIACVNARLSGGAVLRAASETVLQHASETDESDRAELDPTVMAGLLDSGVRVVQSRKGKFDQRALLAIQESASRLRSFEGQQGIVDLNGAFRLLETGLREIDVRFNAALRGFGRRQLRKKALMGGLQSDGTAAETAELLQRKRERRLQRNKEKGSGEASKLAQKRAKRLRRKNRIGRAAEEPERRNDDASKNLTQPKRDGE